MAKILVVDDEAKIREVIREYAQFADHEVTEAEDGQIALDLCTDNDYDLIIMDIMMPNMDGFTACREIRKIKNIPVIMLSARSEEYDVLSGFKLGIDDYVTKPFSPKELLARITAVLARNASEIPSSKDLIFGNDGKKDKGLAINMAARTVSVDGEKVELTPKEYDLLFYLVENKNIALSREQLLSDIWEYEYYDEENDRTVDTHIKNLRSALGDYRDFIVTMRGVGYKFEDE